MQNIYTRDHDIRFIIPKHNSELGASTVKVLGATLWNELPKSLKNCSTIKSFRANYKKSIFSYQN